MAHITVPEDSNNGRSQTVVGGTPTDTFNFTFPFFATTDIKAYEDGVLIDPNDYTVVGTGSAVDGGYSAGTLTLDVAVSNVTVVIERDVPLARTDDFPYPSSTLNIKALNTALDKVFAIFQQFRRSLTRTLRQPVGDTATIDTLPAKATRATKVLAFDADGDPVASTLTLTALEAQVTAAEDFADDAETAAATATTQAGIATTQAGNAATQAGIATTQAGLAAASAAAAAASAGSGLFGTISDKSADFTITADTENTTLFKVDSGSGNINITLPSIATAGEGERYGFLRVSASNTITLVRNGSDTINGVAGNYTLAAVAGEITLIVADDASPDNWIVQPWAQSTADGTTLAKTGAVIALNLANDNTWTGSQRSTPVTDADGSFDMNAANDFLWTPTGADVLEFTNETQGQRGMILLNNTSNYAITFGSEVEIDTDAASILSVTGKYMLSYWCYDGTNVAVAYTAKLT